MSYFTVTKVFLGLEPIFMTDQKYWLTVKFLHVFFLLSDCPMKIKVSQAQSNWFAFKEALSYKRGMRKSAHTRYE